MYHFFFRQVCFLYVLAVALGVRAESTNNQLQQDWLKQAELRYATITVQPEEDAVGAVDGEITGRYGFHTAVEPDPFWQLDLGSPCEIGKVVIYNRCDVGKERNRDMFAEMSDDQQHWKRIWTNSGMVFGGKPDSSPLVIDFAAEPVRGRYLRFTINGTQCLHFDEVQVFPPPSCQNCDENIALHKSATQSSVCEWSIKHTLSQSNVTGKKFDTDTFEKILESANKLAKYLDEAGVNTESEKKQLAALHTKNAAKKSADVSGVDYFTLRETARQLAFKSPELDFDSIVFAKTSPSAFPHMSDQGLSFWHRGNGAICILRNFKSGNPELVDLTQDWKNGTFFRPVLSYDAKKVLFAYAEYNPKVALVQDKVNRDNIAEENFFHLYEMEIASGKTRQLTFGKYDDFDGQYLPDGKIVFLSTRKGSRVQTGKLQMDEMTDVDFPNSYVRCGGDNFRPVVVYTLHTLDPSSDDMQRAEIRQISAFESFEWTPTVLNNGKIAYMRWDYIDRYAQHVSVWEKNPDGTKPTLVFGNYTVRPDITMEPKAIPGSSKLAFVGSAHHSTFGGSLIIFDRNLGTEGDTPVERITPEVPFPESESWENHYYASPAPLSENVFLVSWSNRKLPPHGFVVDENANPSNSLGIYYYDRFGNLELIYRDEEISCVNPIPLKSRPVPPVIPSELDWNGPMQGEFVIQNIYDGLEEYGFTKESQCVKRVRIVGVLPKVQPNMNIPSLGLTGEEPGKFVLGTVPVEADGSARFIVPSNVPYFFQALDENGVAIQTMRTLTDLLPGETTTCIGCHENREKAPTTSEILPLALYREPSKLTREPQGTFPLKYSELVQPVLDRNCVSCHAPGSDAADAAKLDLTPENSYATLMNYGNGTELIEFFAHPNTGNRALYKLGVNALTHNTQNHETVSQLDSALFASRELVRKSRGALKDLAFERDYSIPGEATASQTLLLKIIRGEEMPQINAHKDLRLSDEDVYRLVIWMDTYAMRNGCYCPEQEKELIEFRDKINEFYNL